MATVHGVYATIGPQMPRNSKGGEVFLGLGAQHGAHPLRDRADGWVGCISLLGRIRHKQLCDFGRAARTRN